MGVSGQRSSEADIAAARRQAMTQGDAGGQKAPLPGIKHVVAVASARAASASRPSRPTSPSRSRRRPRRRPPRRRHLRPVAAAHDGNLRPPTPTPDSQENDADGQPRRALHVDRLPGQGGHADDLARPDGDRALEQLLRDVEWGEIDVLVVDMPPGTGDAQLTMSQRVPLAGAVSSRRRRHALLDARKASPCSARSRCRSSASSRT